MAKKKKISRRVLYYQSSHISKKTWKQLCEMSEEGIIVYVQSGKPTGGGCVPGSPGCH